MTIKLFIYLFIFFTPHSGWARVDFCKPVSCYVSRAGWVSAKTDYVAGDGGKWMEKRRCGDILRGLK